MANQAIALQARAPQMTGLSNAIQQNAQMINMMAQQKAAERQAAQAQQAMQLAQAEEVRKARLAEPQFAKASSEALSAQMKAANDFLDFSIEGMKMARNPEDAVKIGGWLKSQFPQAEFQQAVDQTLSSLPQDPSQFGAWREQTLFQSMDAKDQLEQHFNDVTTGRESWTTAAPKYAGSPMGAAAREVPGSRIQAAEDITYVKGPNGEIIPMPKTVPGTGGPVGGGVGGGKNIFDRMINVESGGQQFAKNGAPLTSPKGAIGIAQVMPGTAPEAAALAGLPYDKNRYRTDAQYNRALGKAYYEKQLADFGDERLAVAAYNAGPGAVRRALQKGGPDGWIRHVPRETQDYVRDVFGEGGKASGGVTLGQPIPTAPTKEQRTQQRGRENVSNTVNTLRDLYAELRERGGAVESGGGLMAAPGNIANYIAGTAVGKPFGRALGTKEQATRDKIINVRRMLVTQIADAAGLSAQEMNSNVELQGLLDAATDPTQSIETVEETLNEIERLYGRPGAKGQRISARRSKPAAPKPAPKPAPRRTAGGANVSDW